jgi:hypothetical protein
MRASLIRKHHEGTANYQNIDPCAPYHCHHQRHVYRTWHQQLSDHRTPHLWCGIKTHIVSDSFQSHYTIDNPVTFTYRFYPSKEIPKKETPIIPYFLLSALKK